MQLLLNHNNVFVTITIVIINQPYAGYLQLYT